MTHSFAILITALLLGGMTLCSFGFATFLFKVLPAPSAGATLRLAFPWFYLFVVATAAVAAFLWRSHDTMAATVVASVALTTIPVRQLLILAINQATDSDVRLRCKWLHGGSVFVTLSHIALAGWILARIV